MKALDLAEYVLNKCTKEDCPISNLQLQKILYFIQEDSLKLMNEPIFDDEIQAWMFGPVIPEVYYKFCGYGSSTISFVKEKILDVNTQTKKMIDKIIEEKRKINVWDLINELHKEGTPWYNVYHNEGAKNVITVSAMKECCHV